MRKRVVLALLLVAAMVVTSSCSLIVKDAEVDKQTPIIEVAGKTFTKGEVNTLVQNTLDYQAYLYSMYGMNFDPTSESAISSAQESVITGLIEQAVTDAKMDELGIELTDEELATIQSEAETTYQGYKDTVMNAAYADTELTGDELEAALVETMAQYGYPTLDEIVENSKETKRSEKLKAEIVKDVTVTDEEVQTEYDSRVENAKTTYESNPGSYGTSVTNGTTVYYTPAGYRYVKHILRKFSDEDSQKISDIQSQITDKQTQLSNVESSLSDLGEATEDESEEIAKNRQELTDTQTTLNAEIEDLNKQLDAAREAAYAALQPTIEEIQGKLAEEGADFDALMEEYGEDTGMQSEPAKTNGYPVCEQSTNWVEEFRTAAMALAKVGDISEPVRSTYGIHIIKYVSDAVEGPVAFDEVKDTIESSLLSTKQDETYNAAVDAWVEAANAKVDRDALKD